jgi:hypothetical protein
MKKTALFLVLIIVFIGCKEKKKDLEPAFILTKWATSTKELNYRTYKSCKAYPMPNLSFKTKYQDYYYQDVMVLNIGKVDKENIKKDHMQKKYISKEVSFEGTQYKRITHRAAVLIRGTVDFRKYSDNYLK